MDREQRVGNDDVDGGPEIATDSNHVWRDGHQERGCQTGGFSQPTAANEPGEEHRGNSKDRGHDLEYADAGSEQQDQRRP